MIRFLKWVFNFKDQKNRLLLNVLISFLISSVVVRVFSLYTGYSIYIGGYQIHHFYFGMLFLSLGGMFGVLSKEERPLEFASTMMGIGIGLFADEIGLLLSCTDTGIIKHVCAYAFPNVFDIIIWVSSAIFIIIILSGLVEKYYLSQKK